MDSARLQKTAQIAAKNLFGRLDNTLTPKVYMIGIPIEGEDCGTACIYQENNVYNATMFSNIIEKTRQLKVLEGLSDCTFCYLSEDEKIAKCSLHTTPLREIILKCVSYNQPENVITFCSQLIFINNRFVFFLIQFSKDAYLKYYSLMKPVNNPSFQVNSLIHATAIEFLQECAKALLIEDFDLSDTMASRDTDEIIRSGGKRLASRLALTCEVEEGAFELFNTFNTISSLRYEGSASVGKILLSKKRHINAKEVLTFETPVKLNDYRAVRKLLEMTRFSSYLLSDSRNIYGIGIITGSYDQRSENIFSINFTKHYTWELHHAESIIMKVAFGQPELPKPLVHEEEFIATMQQVFTIVSNKEMELLWTLVNEASKQAHGTMVVIYEDAELEAKRLQKQATRIEPIQLTPDMINAITAIDGAILIDQKSCCYAIGVILDGFASNKGTPARGARYNSAIRYVEAVDKPCIAVVVSEDGSIDLVHNS